MYEKVNLNALARNVIARLPYLTTKMSTSYPIQSIQVSDGNLVILIADMLEEFTFFNHIEGALVSLLNVKRSFLGEIAGNIFYTPDTQDILLNVSDVYTITLRTTEYIDVPITFTHIEDDGVFFIFNNTEIQLPDNSAGEAEVMETFKPSGYTNTISSSCINNAYMIITRENVEIENMPFIRLVLKGNAKAGLYEGGELIVTQAHITDNFIFYMRNRYTQSLPTFTQQQNTIVIEYKGDNGFNTNLSTKNSGDIVTGEHRFTVYIVISTKDKKDSRARLVNKILQYLAPAINTIIIGNKSLGTHFLPNILSSSFLYMVAFPEHIVYTIDYSIPFRVLNHNMYETNYQQKLLTTWEISDGGK